jgi:hypothetical protein
MQLIAGGSRTWANDRQAPMLVNGRATPFSRPHVIVVAPGAATILSMPIALC